jgi:hypothetical protein
MRVDSQNEKQPIVPEIIFLESLARLTIELRRELA